MCSCQICGAFNDPQVAAQRLDTNEIATNPRYGYGIKSFALSMIETAIEISDSKVSAGEINDILDIIRTMLETEIELLEGVEETLAVLSQRYLLMLITKGDPSEQGRKISRSGLAKYFRHVEITGEKTKGTYQTILEKYHIQPGHFLMIGNSLKSDILPVLEIGGQAIYIPHTHTWSHEVVEEDPARDIQSIQIEQFSHLVAKIDELSHTNG